MDKEIPNSTVTIKKPNTEGEKVGEMSDSVREMYQRLGNKVYNLIDVELDEKSVKKNAEFLAVEAAKADEISRKADFREKHEKLAKIAENKIVKAITTLAPVGIVDTIRRSVSIHEYKKFAQKAIKDTGKMSAGSMVVEQLRKTKKYNEDLLTDDEKEYGVLEKGEILENVKYNVDNIDQSLDVALQSRVDEAFEAGETNTDLGVEIGKNEDEDSIKKALVKYATVVAGAKGGERGAKNKLRKELDEIGEDYSKYKDEIEKMSEDLRGKLSDELSLHGNTKKHKDAVAAIDAYIRDNVNIADAVVDAGLAVDNVYKDTSTAAAAKFGVAAGIIVGVGGTLLNFEKNAVINKLTNSSIVCTTMKMALAGGIGAVKGYKTKERAQRSKNIENALNVDNEEVEIDKEKEFAITSVDKKIAEMQAIEFENGKFFRLNEKGRKVSLQPYEIIDLVSELRAKNELQNKYGIQLLGYNGRENVEKTKLEMFKQINRLQKNLLNVDEDIFEEIDFVTNSNKEKYTQEINKISSKQKKERAGAAVKNGLITAGSAGIASFAFDYIKGSISNGKLFSSDNSKLLTEIKGLKNGNLKWDGLHVVAVSDAGVVGAVAAAENAGAAIDSDNNQEVIKEYKGALIIEDDPDGGIAVGFDADGDGKLDVGEFLHGEGSERGLDLTDDKVYEDLTSELKGYGIDLNREPIMSSAYNKISISDYLNNKENAVETGNVDWSKSATKVVFGKPVAVVGDGMDQYEVAIKGINGGEIPDGAKFFIDLDGDGPGKALEFSIEDGKAIIPADVLDTSAVGNGGVANFIGTARVGEIDNGSMISYATSIGKKASLDSIINANVSENAYAFTAVNDSGEKISQFAVNSANEKISNLSEIFNGIEVADSDRLPMTFTESANPDSAITLASGESFGDYDVSGGYHPEYDAFENKAFFAGKNFLGTPMTWDANGDGVMDSGEELSYIKQLFVRTGTNPFMLGQNASNYGILEPDRLRSIFGNDYDTFLAACGITDGVIDSEAELNSVIEALKSNPEYWDKIANETIDEMERQLRGGGFELGRVTNRLSTYANSNDMFDTAHAKTERYVLYPYHTNEDGVKEYVGNQGWWCRKYGVEGGKVGDMPLCEQKCVTTKTSSEKTSTEKTSSEKTTTEKTSAGKTGNEKTGNEKTTSEKTSEEKTSSEKTSDEKTSDETTIAPKGPNTHAGDYVEQAPVTPMREETNYVEATPENHVEPEPGSSTLANAESANSANTNYSNEQLREVFAEF